MNTNTDIITMNTDKPVVNGGRIVEITDDSYAALVGKSRLPVLLTFYTEPCALCERVLGRLVEAMPPKGGDCLIAKADIENCPQLVGRFGIWSAPMLLLLNRDAVTYQFVGELSRQEMNGLLALVARSHAATHHSTKPCA